MSALTEKLAQYGVNLSVTLERFTGDESLYERCFYILLKDNHFTSLGEHLEAQNYEEAFAAAHALKGVVGNLGLTPLYQAICLIVDALRTQKYDNLKPQYNEIIRNLETLKKF